jgi:hypothetical protein
MTIHAASDPASPATATVAEITLDQLHSRPVRDGAAYWQGLKGARAYPAREDISPRQMRAFLRYTTLIRALDDGADFEYRIVGDAHVAAYGFHIKGLKLSAMDHLVPGHAPRLAHIYYTARKRAAPLALRGWAMRGTSLFFHESVFLPLGPDTGTVDHILNITDYTPPY